MRRPRRRALRRVLPAAVRPPAAGARRPVAAFAAADATTAAGGTAGAASVPIRTGRTSGAVQVSAVARTPLPPPSPAGSNAIP
ncbi:hypothetical protein ACFW5S_32760 [Streptomyces olivaceus]|uniref:hypothetical protein n=1 Tax=Streptomyces olivaceus TaxID=47716 RepID=UPI0036C10E57